MTTNPTKMPRRAQFAITGVGALIAAVLAVFLFNPEDQFVYTVTRLLLSLIGFPACAAILFQSISRVREISDSPEQRLRMVTIVLLLTEIAALLAIGAVISWNDPPPTNTATAVLGVMIRGSLAFGATIIAVTRSKDVESVLVSKREYAAFMKWKKAHDSH